MKLGQKANMHPVSKIPLLSNHRLLLRQPTLEDIPAMMDIAVYNGIFAKTEAEAIIILKKINQNIANGSSLHWAIFSKESGELAGTCGYYRGFDGNCGEVGYVLKQPYRGRGIMTEAVKMIVAYGFSTLKLDTIVAYTDPDNNLSKAVLQRAGFKEAKSDNSDCRFEQHRPNNSP